MAPKSILQVSQAGRWRAGAALLRLSSLGLPTTAVEGVNVGPQGRSLVVKGLEQDSGQIQGRDDETQS